MANDSILGEFDPTVTAVLNDARRTSPVEPDSGLLAAMSAAAVAAPLARPTTLPRRKTMIGKLVTTKALALAGALALTGGVAAAATGTLPDPVQSPVSNAVEHVGVHIPQGDHGAAVSDAAHDKNVTGKNHGQDVSTVARDNHGHAGDSTTTTEVGDDNGVSGSDGPGKSKGHANDHATKDKTGADDSADQDTNDDQVSPSTTRTNSSPSTTVESHGRSDNSGPNNGSGHADDGGSDH